jgi:hypothetical protein
VADLADVEPVPPEATVVTMAVLYIIVAYITALNTMMLVARRARAR